MQSVTVPRHHENPIAQCFGLRHQCRDDVVGFEAGFGHHRDAHGTEDVLGDVHLTGELVRRLTSVRLVGREPLGPERLPRHIERRRDMRRLFVSKQVDQHGGEPVHRVGGLAAGGLEVVHRQREERAKGDGMTVDQQQRRLLTVGGTAGRGFRCCAVLGYGAHG